MQKITLYSLETTDIKISMQIYFNEKEQLYFDGYDIGKKVNELMGDSDYEYIYIIEPIEVFKFYPLFDLKTDDKNSLLQLIKSKFSNNNAYTLFGNFMNEHNIKYERFIWR